MQERRLAKGETTIIRIVRDLTGASPAQLLLASVRYLLVRLRTKRIGVRGWRGIRSGLVLYWLAAFAPGAGPVIEVGTAWGLSGIIMGSAIAWKARGRLETIDPHTGDPLYLNTIGRGEINSYEEFLENVKRVELEELIIPIRATSRQAAQTRKGPAGRMIFLDGLHTYDAVTEDVELWLPHLQPDALLIFDDYDNPLWPGVQQAVDEATRTGKIEMVGVLRGLAIARVATRPNTPAGSRNRVRDDTGAEAEIRRRR